MVFIVFFVVVVILFKSVVVRTLVMNPVQTVKYACLDLYHYIKYHKWNNCNTGYIKAYCGLFGKGKTLSCVHKVVSIYQRCNGKRVWCQERKKFVRQVIKVISNVSLSIPYEHLDSLQQLVRVANLQKDIDMQNDTFTVTIALLDELSVQMNSRNFKTNIDPLFLNTLLTCRHYHLGLVYSAQRFGQVDALMRQVTSNVTECNKVWRVQVQSVYDAWQLENASDPTMVTPNERSGWFVKDSDYNNYDTYACVDNLQKACQNGDMISSDEILNLQRNMPDSEQIFKPSKKYIRHRKKLK